MNDLSTIPCRIPSDNEDAAEAALARFRAQWPPERCERLAALAGVEQEDAADDDLLPMSSPSMQQAIDRYKDAVREGELRRIDKGLRRYVREMGK